MHPSLKTNPFKCFLFFLNAHWVHRIGRVGIIAHATVDFLFYYLFHRDAKGCLLIFLNNCKGSGVVMNHFLLMTLYSEAVEDLIE